MSGIVEELGRAYELRGDTYSSAEIWGLIGRAKTEIERLRGINAEMLAALKEVEMLGIPWTGRVRDMVCATIARAEDEK